MPLRSSRVNKSTRKRTSSVVSDNEKEFQDGSKTDSKKRQKTSVDIVKSSAMSTDENKTTKVCDKTSTLKTSSTVQSKDQEGSTPQSTTAIIPVFGKWSSPHSANKKQPLEGQRKEGKQCAFDCSTVNIVSEATNECTNTATTSFAEICTLSQEPPVLCKETGGLTTQSVENETNLMPELRITKVKVNENPEVTLACDRIEDGSKKEVTGERSETENTSLRNRILVGLDEQKEEKKETSSEIVITKKVPFSALNDSGKDEKAVMECGGVSAKKLLASETIDQEDEVITKLTEKEQKVSNRTADDEELITLTGTGHKMCNRAADDRELTKLAETGQEISNRTADDKELTELAETGQKMSNTGTADDSEVTKFTETRQEINNRTADDKELITLAETGQKISNRTVDDEEGTTKEAPTLEFAKINGSATPTISLAAGNIKPDKLADEVNHPQVKSDQPEDYLLDDAADVMDFTSSQLLKLEEAESCDVVQSKVVNPVAKSCPQIAHQAVGGEATSDSSTSQQREQRQTDGKGREVMRKMMKDLNEIKLVTGSLLSQMSQYRKHRSQRQPQPSAFGLASGHQSTSGKSTVQQNKARGSMTSQFKKY